MEACVDCEYKGSKCRSQCMKVVAHTPQWWLQLLSQLPAEEQKRITKECEKTTKRLNGEA